MTLQKIRKKISNITAKSFENAEARIEDIVRHREAFHDRLNGALDLAAGALAIGDRADPGEHLDAVLEHARALGHYAYDLFPSRRLKQFRAKLGSLSPEQKREVAQLIRSHQDLQALVISGTVPEQEISQLASNLRALDTALASILAPPSERAAVLINNAATGGLARLIHAAIQPIGWSAEQVSKPLKSADSWYKGGKLARGVGDVLDGFLSRDSLAKTGFETSWGIRLLVTGTVGIYGNAGPWVMAYTGRLRDYQAMAVPFRINPGATLATDVATFTWNRPGFGAGSATPLASGYVDGARSKLLIGRDGIAYLRIGEWEGRGPYFTVSAFIPLLPWMHITWNASIFSPGWAPLVTWSRPAVIWVRGQADWLYRTATKPFGRP